MGRELQKKKNRSSIAKVRRKPKSKKRILSNHIIAANWDKSQTLAQNYRRLGLAARLNKNTGGVEKTATDLEREHENGEAVHDQRHGLVIGGGSRKPAQAMDLKEVEVERDAKTGKILRVLDAGNARANPLHDPLNEFDSDSEGSRDGMFDQHGNPTAVDKGAVSKPRTSTIEELERESKKPETRFRRQQSEGERAFVEALVKKHEEDYGKMARDMKINYMQRSEGDLKRRVKKWKESGGVVE